MSDLTTEEQLARYGAAAERAAMEAESPGPVLPLEPAPPTTPSERRWLAMAAAVLSVLGLATAAVALAGDPSTQVATDPRPVPNGPSTYTHPQWGWSAEIPDGWYVREFQERCWQGFVVVDTERDLDPLTDSCSTDLDRWIEGPGDVAIVVYLFNGSRPARGDPMVPDTEFPLDPEVVGDRGTVAVIRDGRWTDEHVGIQMGAAASDPKRDRAGRILASLRPPSRPPLRTEEVERWWAGAGADEDGEAFGDALLLPTWLPGGLDRWTLASEGADGPGDELQWRTTWRTLAPDPDLTTACGTSTEATLSIGQLPLAAFDSAARPPTAVGTRTVRSRTAVEGASVTAAISDPLAHYLWWEEGEMLVVLTALRPCDGVEPMGFDELAVVAEGLR